MNCSVKVRNLCTLMRGRTRMLRRVLCRRLYQSQAAMLLDNLTSAASLSRIQKKRVNSPEMKFESNVKTAFYATPGLRMVHKFRGYLSRIETLEKELEVNNRQISLMSIDIDKLKAQEKDGRLAMQKKNLLTQHRLKTLGKNFGDLIVEVAKACEVEYVHFVFSRYTQYFQAQPYHYNAVIFAHCKRKDMLAAVNVFNLMKDLRVNPDAYTYSKMVLGYSLLDDAKEIHLLIAELRRLQIKPTEECMNDAIATCSEEYFDDAFEWSRLLMEWKFHLRSHALRSLLRSVYQHPYVGRRKSWDLFESKVIKHTLDGKLLNTFIVFYASKGYVDRCIPILRKITTLGTKIDKGAAAVLVRLFNMKKKTDLANLALKAGDINDKTNRSRRPGPRHTKDALGPGSDGLLMNIARQFQK